MVTSITLRHINITLHVVLAASHSETSYRHLAYAGDWGCQVLRSSLGVLYSRKISYLLSQQNLKVLPTIQWI